MKLWRLIEQLETPYAEAWLRSPARHVKPAACDYCGRGAEYEDPRPLVIEWEAGSDVVGDFVWPGGGRVAAQRRVFDIMTANLRGIEPGSVEMVQDPKLKRPTRKTRRTRPRVWLPYEGPELVELWVQRSVHTAPGTAIEPKKPCPKCGHEAWTWSGVEVKQHIWDKEQMKLVPLFIPRDPERGLRIRASDVEGASIFRTIEFPNGILCTDAVRELIERERFTNVDFLDYGDLV